MNERLDILIERMDFMSDYCVSVHLFCELE